MAVAAGEALVVVIEASEEESQTICSMIGRLGMRSVAVGDGYDALFAIADEKPTVILLDIALPAPGALAFLDAARTAPSARGVPVVAMGDASESDAELGEAIEARGVTEWLDKPFNRWGLAAVLSRVVPGLQLPSAPSTSGGGLRSRNRDGSDSFLASADVITSPTDRVAAVDVPPGPVITPIRAELVRHEGGAAAELLSLSADVVHLESLRHAPRAGDLQRVVLRAERGPPGGPPVHVELLTRVGAVRKEKIGWRMTLAVEDARPEADWRALLAVSRGHS
jgi:CheY-like chemotaxis protein